MKMGAGLSLKGRALKYLAAREHSRPELRRKLARYVDDEGTLEALLDELESKDLLSAERFVASVIHRKQSRFGLARIERELSSHDLPQQIVEEGISSLCATEFDRAKAVWSRKFGEAATSPEDRARHYRFLLMRGFSSEVVRRVLREAETAAG